MTPEAAEIARHLTIRVFADITEGFIIRTETDGETVLALVASDPWGWGDVHWFDVLDLHFS